MTVQVIVHSVFILIMGQYVYLVVNVTIVTMVLMEHVDHAGKASQREKTGHVPVNRLAISLNLLTLFKDIFKIALISFYTLCFVSSSSYL